MIPTAEAYCQWEAASFSQNYSFTDYNPPSIPLPLASGRKLQLEVGDLSVLVYFLALSTVSAQFTADKGDTSCV